MSIEIIGVIMLILGIVSILWFEQIKFEVLLAATLLGSAAAVVFPAMAISIQPAHLLLGLFMASELVSPEARQYAAKALRFGSPGFWLSCTFIYGAVGAFLFPRLFEDLTQVNAIGVTAWGFSFSATPLITSSGNITQTIYFAGDVAVFVIGYIWAQSGEGRSGFARALLVYAIGIVVFAAADLATFWTGTGYLLEFIRNSAYVLHNETIVLDLKRIVGSFTEASQFAYASIGALACTLSLWLDGVKPRLTLFLSVVTAILLIMCASTTAYVALPIVAIAIFGAAALRTLTQRATPQTVNFVIFTPLVLAMAVLILFQMPSALEMVTRYLDILVFSKSNSDSGMQRGELSATALQNFFDTYGFGVGIGSARGSGFVTASLANLGAIGSIAYCAFLAQVIGGRNSSAATNESAESAPYLASAGWCCFAMLVASVLSGALIDLGLPFYILAGFISGSRDYVKTEHLLEQSMSGAFEKGCLPERIFPDGAERVN
jgi:hypothetical protein